MKRTTLNFLTDAAGFVGFVLLATTGVLVRYVLPPGSGKHTHVWGLDRHEWGAVHFWVSVAFLAVLAVHVVLHWRWVLAVVAGKAAEASGMRFALGVVALLAVLGLAVAPLVSPVQREHAEPGSRPAAAPDAAGASEEEIRGYMTFRDVEAATGVPAAYILQHLGLPADTSLDERLGEFGREHGFKPARIREIVREYHAGK